MLYLDTSALAKLYVLEADSGRVRKLAEQNENLLFTSLITYAELLSVLARALREKRMSRTSYQLQKRAFLRDWKGCHIISVTPEVLSPLPGLIERHNLRGFDAIHLCSALWIGRPIFGCFDQRLSQAARAEGLEVAP